MYGKITQKPVADIDCEQYAQRRATNRAWLYEPILKAILAKPPNRRRHAADIVLADEIGHEVDVYCPACGNGDQVSSCGNEELWPRRQCRYCGFCVVLEREEYIDMDEDWWLRIECPAAGEFPHQPVMADNECG